MTSLRCESKERNKQELKQTRRHRERIGGCQRGLGGWVKGVKELRSTNWHTKWSWGCKKSTGNIVNNIAITMYGTS